MKTTFFVQSFTDGIPRSRPRPHFVLTTNSWDDYGTKSLFALTYIAADGARSEIGSVKILRRVGKAIESREGIAKRTELDAEFTELDKSCISLGQSEDYYNRLYTLLGAQGADVLTALRDIAWLPNIAESFETTSAFRNSLLRSNGAMQARRFGNSLARGEAIERDFSFRYECHIPNAELPVVVDVRFDSNDLLPSRVVGLVGRNATGKTQFLSTLARDLVQLRQASDEGQKAREDRFGGRRPLFTRVVAVSYSAFDRFVRPTATTTSYVYCGIRGDRAMLTRSEMAVRFREHAERIHMHGRLHQWSRNLRKIFSTMDDDLLETITSSEIEEDSVKVALAKLSSGQAILAHFVTALLAWLEPNSLVLFDEPETHLHPNAVAVLFNSLHSILEEFDSFAILATHSPIVVQEIPGKNVVHFQREGNITVASELDFESFGESLSELTRHVFETSEIPTLYRRTLRALSSAETLAETLKRFPKGLSLSAEAYLIAQHAKRPSAK